MKRMSEPGWLVSSRHAAEQTFRAMPMPSRKDELFKYTALGELPFELEQPSSIHSAGGNEILPEREAGEEALLRFENGFGLSAPSSASNTFDFCDLHQAIQQKSELVEAVFRRSQHRDADKFALFTEAKWSQGAFLQVKEGSRVALPLRILQVQSEKCSSFHFRHLIRVERGAELVLVDELGDAAPSLDFEGFVSGLIDIEVEADAKLRILQVQNLAPRTKYIVRKRLRLDRGASCEYFTLGTGGGKGQDRLDVNLAGEGANFRAVGVVFGEREQHNDFVAFFRHTASHTQSSLDHWSVLSGRARAVFNGLVHVEQKALHTDAYQKSRALLLSRDAVMHSMPKLIIGTDEVACQHGASISCVDPEHKFYLESRGLDPSTAVRFIVDGFTEPVLQALPTERMRERWGGVLAQKDLGVH